MFENIKEIILVLFLILIILIAIKLKYFHTFQIYWINHNNMKEEFLGGNDKKNARKKILMDEYNNFQKSKAYLDKLNHLIYNKYKLYEANNILERWILSSINFEKDIPIMEQESTKKMIEEFIEKNIVNKEDAHTFVKIILEQKPRIEKGYIPYKIYDDGTIKMGNFVKKISKNRLKLLRRKGSDYDIVRASLRYAAVISGGQQWNIPCKVYETLVNNYQFEIEGFASPFNSQIIRFGDDKKFCSLFLDTDEVFGSVGNFFNYNFVGKRATINPPYVLSIMEKAIDKVFETINAAKRDQKETLLFITVPNWTDTNYYSRLINNSNKHIRLEKNKYYYENSNKEDEKILAKFDSSVFIMSYPENLSSRINENDILKSFSP